MKATVYHGKGDVRLERVSDPAIRETTDAIVRVVKAAICGSDLWFYRGITQLEPGDRTGHEFVGIIAEVGRDVRNVKAGDYVIAPFVSSDGFCEFCKVGLQTSCVHMSYYGDDKNGGQAQAVRVPYADGTLVKMADGMAEDPKKLAAAAALTDVMGTGHHGIVSACVRIGSTVVVVGDGAVGLCAVLSAARVVRAERIIAVGHNEKRLELAKEFGATHTVNSHDGGVAETIVELTQGGASSVVEAVGNQETMDLAIEVSRPGGTVSFVGVPHNVNAVALRTLFTRNVSLRGALAPVRAYIPRLMSAVMDGSIDPWRVFDLELPLERVAEGYAAMDSRRAIKVLLNVE
ncbi:MAG: alcohol dehydrogenase catalytic domain-containing protein [Candidatus Eremiobacteraeota bacterium]|nr:alcohol dehydrogenase catalytic domain-containing protein [Candidatus Eremiobacteraeota bacterium]